jgi:hypothetical protein
MSARRMLVTLFLLFALASCGPIQRAQQAAYAKDRIAQARLEAATCVERRKAGEIKTRVESAQCVNDALQRGLADIHYPYMDLFLAFSASRLRIAEQFDQGQLGETEMQARMMEVQAVWQGNERQRNDDAAVRNAAVRTMDANTNAIYSGMIITGLGMMGGR